MAAAGLTRMTTSAAIYKCCINSPLLCPRPRLWLPRPHRQPPPQRPKPPRQQPSQTMVGVGLREAMFAKPQLPYLLPHRAVHQGSQACKGAGTAGAASGAACTSSWRVPRARDTRSITISSNTAATLQQHCSNTAATLLQISYLGGVGDRVRDHIRRLLHHIRGALGD